MEIRKAAVFGATGATGKIITSELLRRGVSVRVVSRSEANLRQAFGALEVERLDAELLDPVAAVEAAIGCDVIFHCVGLPYPRFEDHPTLARNTVKAMRATHARCILISSYYGYEPIRSRLVTEDHPRVPTSFKGRMRKEQEDILRDAGAAVTLLPDFYGPGADLSLVGMALRSLVSGKTANWIGRLDIPRQYVFVPDIGRPIVDLATHDAAFGERWNLAGTGLVTARELFDMARPRLARPPRFRTADRTLLRVLGLVSPLMRELVELYPLYTSSFALDTTKLRGLIGQYPVTPYEVGIRSSIDWLIGASSPRPRSPRAR